MPKEMTAGELAERSLITKYRKTIWNRFIGGCKDYELIKPGDRIAVCISGGKDSMMLAKCMQHLQKYSDFPFEVEYLVMDPGYSPPNRELIERNARTRELPIRIFESPIFGVVDESEGGSPCYLCARMRRGYLYKEAQALGCTVGWDNTAKTVILVDTQFSSRSSGVSPPSSQSTNSPDSPGYTSTSSFSGFSMELSYPSMSFSGMMLPSRTSTGIS